MTDDAELLRRYADEKSEEAFAELVQRNLGLVYHAALRQCGGDAHRAEDVAQAVFTDLARKAGELARRPVLAGWLYTSTRYAAAQAVRTEVRRQAREREAQAMNEILAEGDGGGEAAVEWDRMRPVIDDAMHALGERDREAVLLRFFEGRAFAEVGAAMRLTEDAARMRVERALEKLRVALGRRGITSTSAALGSVLTNQAAAMVPAGVAASVTGAALAGASVGVGVGAGAGAGAWAVFFTMSKIKIGVVGVLVAAMAITGVVALRANRGLREEVGRLRHQAAALRTEASEVAGLRQENTQLRQAVANRRAATEESSAVSPAADAMPARSGAKPIGMKPRDGWRNLGRASPTEAYETVMWASDRGDLDVLSTAFVLSDAQRVEAERIFNRLPDEGRVTYQTPERMMALLFASGAPAALQPISETTKGAEVTVRARVWNDRGETNELELPFRRYPDGWRVVIPEWQMNKSLARLRK